MTIFPPEAGSSLSDPPIKENDPALNARPLTAATRETLALWLWFFSASHDVQVKGHKATRASIAALGDDDLVALYRTSAKFKAGEGFHPTGPPNPVGSITDFLSMLANPSLWIRIGEFVVGGVLIAVAVNAALKQSTGVSPAGTAAKVAKVVK